MAAAAAVTADDDPLLVHIVEIRSRNLMWGLFRGDDALAANGLACDRRQRSRRQGGAAPQRGVGAHATPDGRSTRSRCSRRSPPCPLPGPGRCGLTPRCLRSSPRDAARRRRRRRPTSPSPSSPVSRTRSPSPIPASTSSPRSTPSPNAGGSTRPMELAIAAYELTPTTAPPDGLVWLSHQLGRCALLRRAGRDGQALARRSARPDAMRTASSVRAGWCCPSSAPLDACLGDAAAAAAAVVEMDRRPEFPFTRPEQELGRAWALAAAGDLPGARRRAAAPRRTSPRRRGTAIAEAWLLHDVARLGDPASVVDRLGELASACEGELVGAVCEPCGGRCRRPAGGARRSRAIASRGSAPGCSPPSRRAEAAQAFQRARRRPCRGRHGRPGDGAGGGV